MDGLHLGGRAAGRRDAQALSLELGTPINAGFEALVFKASRGIEDIYDLTYIRKDGSRFPEVVSVTALRDEADQCCVGSQCRSTGSRLLGSRSLESRERKGEA
jgi:hypothetical protein